MPSKEQLPSELQQFHYLQAVPIRQEHADFDRHIQRLMANIEGREPPADGNARVPAELPRWSIALAFWLILGFTPVLPIGLWRADAGYGAIAFWLPVILMPLFLFYRFVTAPRKWIEVAAWLLAGVFAIFLLHAGGDIGREHGANLALWVFDERFFWAIGCALGAASMWLLSYVVKRTLEAGGLAPSDYIPHRDRSWH
jgi:hypothetical protein